MKTLFAVMIVTLPLAARAEEPTAAAAAAPAAAAQAPAQTSADQRAELQKMAQIIAEDYTDQQYAESMAKIKGSKLPATRREALRAIYAKLAELDYQDSLKNGGDEKAAKAGLQETGAPIETGWGDWAQSVYNGLSQPSNSHYNPQPRFSAVAAVRGGREVSAEDPELAPVREELTKVGRSLDDSALPKDKRAELLLKRGSLYSQLAVAQAFGDERERLLAAAHGIGENYTDESWKFKTARREALRQVYAKLAALDYQDSLKTGPAVDEKAQVQAALETVNAGAPIETGWGDWAQSVYNGLSQPSNSHYNPQPRFTAVAAVRGGRAITADDAELSGIVKEMEEVDGSLKDTALAPEKKADLLYRRGRLFNRLAARSTAAPAAEAAQLSPKEIYEKYSPAVVVIVAMGKDGVGELGTGSIIDAQGRVLTNAHVVTRDRDQKPYETVKIFLKPAVISGDNKKDLKNAVAMRVARYDRPLDLAVLEPVSPYAVPATISFGASSAIEPGEPVVAIGHPEQGGLWTLTSGVISATLADLGGVKGKDVFQTDASINRGNSGGPLLSRAGLLVGVNTSMARKASDGLTITSVNFSIKAAVVQRWLAGGDGDRTVAAAPAAVEAPAVAAVETPKPAPKPAAAAPAEKPAIVTPAKPYRVESVLEDERKASMQEMEDLETEMRGDVERARGR